MEPWILFVHWHRDEAEELAAPLRNAGWTVQAIHWGDQIAMKDLRARPPAAMVISLRRLPSHGRAMADALWSTRWGRQIPILFFDGAPDKVAQVREQFPAAQFTTFEGLRDELERAAGRTAETAGKTE